MGVLESVPNPVDVHVGRRVRLRRRAMGMSQATLSEALGLTFQQVQKYERGSNRISASKLFEITSVLEVPITYFFENLLGPSAAQATTHPQAYSRVVEDLLLEPSGLQLAEAFLGIRARSVRKSLADLAQALAANDDGPPRAASVEVDD